MPLGRGGPDGGVSIETGSICNQEVTYKGLGSQQSSSPQHGSAACRRLDAPEGVLVGQHGRWAPHRPRASQCTARTAEAISPLVLRIAESLCWLAMIGCLASGT